VFSNALARKKNERKMAQLRLDLVHLTRVMTMNEISGSLAHEITQPLGAILANSQAARILMSETQDKRVEILEILDDIIHDSTRAGDVIRKLRSLVKKEDKEPFQLLPINSLIDDVLEMLHGSIVENKISLKVDLKPDSPNVRGDRVHLEQVLLNLITNGIDAMKDTPSKILRIRSAMDIQDMVTVSVSDSGPGIVEDRRALLFQPFFTTKNDGLGLGLSICRSIIKEHGGQIWEDINPDGGATFSFSLKAWI
jgi:two-component system sensor kinase FixL